MLARNEPKLEVGSHMESDNEKPRKKKRRPHWVVRGLGPSFTACMGFVISVLYITFP